MSDIVYKLIFKRNDVMTHYERHTSKTKAKNILKEHAKKFRLCSRCDGYYVFTNECPPVISIEIVEET
jgi:hypothetical protein